MIWPIIIFYYNVLKFQFCHYIYIIILIFNQELENMTTEFKYDIVEEIAVLSESSKGWTKQLNIISWNGKDPKYDVREWAPDRSKMGKGVTLSIEEAIILKMALDTRDDLE